MKTICLVACLAGYGGAALAQTTEPSPSRPASDREQVQADRAKAAAQEKSAPTARPWDRDVSGKRPWDRGYAPK